MPNPAHLPHSTAPVLDPALLNDIEAARILGVQPATLRSWRCRGIGPAYTKLGLGVRAATRYHRDDLAAFIAQGRREPDNPVRAALERN